jgi:hypothetical protein
MSIFGGLAFQCHYEAEGRSSCPVGAFAREKSTRRLVRRKAVLNLDYNGTSCFSSQAPSSMHFRVRTTHKCLALSEGLGKPCPLISHVPFVQHTGTPLLPEALASVSFGFVLVRVRVRHTSLYGELGSKSTTAPFFYNPK